MCTYTPIAYFDYSDVEKIHSGIGDKVAVFLQFFTTFIACFVIALVTNWKLALVVSVSLPALVLMGVLLTKV
jgi:ABC-type multidrug transport system fused ATPase/permease subunit